MKKKTKRWLLATAALVFLAGSAGLGVWMLSVSRTLTRVLLPDTLVLTPPAADVPAGIAAFVGVWGGDRWAGRIPHALAVEHVAADGTADLIYAWGSDRETALVHGWVRRKGRIADGHLTFALPGGNVADYSLAAGGHLLGRYTTPAGWRNYVLLSRVTGADTAQIIAEAGHRSDPLWQTVDIPERATAGDAAGDTLTLEAALYRTTLPGRRPLIVLNHDLATHGGEGETRRFEDQARLFLSLGYSVVVPMRKGRGDSDGPLLEVVGRPKSPPVDVQIASGLEDIDATVAYMSRQPYVDPQRIVMAGYGRGGLLAVIYAGRHPDKVAGAINFSGGWWPENELDRGIDKIDVELLGAAGRTAKAPMLWLYAQGDTPAAVTRAKRGFAAFRAAGGAGHLVLVPDPSERKAYLGRLFLWTAKWEIAVSAYLTGDAHPSFHAGVAQVKFKNPLGSGTMQGTIFYPAFTRPGTTHIGVWTVDAVRDAALPDGRFPLILFSHGYGSHQLSHYDSATDLARHGFIVVTLTHPGDDFRNFAAWRTDRELVGREYDLREALDEVLADSVFGDRVDPGRIGVVGFALGGYTALTLVGARPNLARFADYCRDQFDPTCATDKGPPAVRPGLRFFRDPRVKSAFLMAPGPGDLFDRDGLRDVAVPIHIESAAADTVMPPRVNAERIRDLLPRPPEYVAIPGAGHFIFQASCPASLLRQFPDICGHAPGIDRKAVHARLDAAMVDFFTRTLPAR